MSGILFGGNMKEDRHKAPPEEVRQRVEHYIDYLWLMRSFEEELAKEAQELLMHIKVRHTKRNFQPAQSS